MFGTRRTSTNDRYGDPSRDRGQNAGPTRDGRGVSPLLGGIAGTVLQNFIARKVVGRVVGRAGGLPGMLLGMGVTYALNRLMNGKRQSRRY